MAHNMVFFYGEELSAPLPTPKLEDHPFLAVRDFLFNIFASTPHIGDRSSIRSLRTHHAVLAGPTYHGPRTPTKEITHFFCLSMTIIYRADGMFC
jgi:hypothetical protein